MHSGTEIPVSEQEYSNPISVDPRDLRETYLRKSAGGQSSEFCEIIFFVNCIFLIFSGYIIYGGFLLRILFVRKKLENEILIQNSEQLKVKIYLIRGVQVMLDSDLAEIYGYSTKAFNQQVKNNLEKFDEDFMFQLTK